MIASVPPEHATVKLSQDFDTLQQALEARFTDLGQFEGYLKAQQQTWDDPVIALHNVEARVSLSSEAADGLVRVELQNGSRENWHFWYLKEGGLCVPPFEDFWVEPVGGDYA